MIQPDRDNTLRVYRSFQFFSRIFKKQQLPDNFYPAPGRACHTPNEHQ